MRLLTMRCFLGMFGTAKMVRLGPLTLPAATGFSAWIPLGKLAIGAVSLFRFLNRGGANAIER
jgi:hypothetical protein